MRTQKFELGYVCSILQARKEEKTFVGKYEKPIEDENK